MALKRSLSIHGTDASAPRRVKLANTVHAEHRLPGGGNGTRRSRAVAAAKSAKPKSEQKSEEQDDTVAAVLSPTSSIGPAFSTCKNVSDTAVRYARRGNQHVGIQPRAFHNTANKNKCYRNAALTALLNSSRLMGWLEKSCIPSVDPVVDKLYYKDNGNKVVPDGKQVYPFGVLVQKLEHLRAAYWDPEADVDAAMDKFFAHENNCIHDEQRWFHKDRLDDDQHDVVEFIEWLMNHINSEFETDVGSRIADFQTSCKKQKCEWEDANRAAIAKGEDPPAEPAASVVPTEESLITGGFSILKQQSKRFKSLTELRFGEHRLCANVGASKGGCAAVKHRGKIEGKYCWPVSTQVTTNVKRKGLIEGNGEDEDVFDVTLDECIRASLKGSMNGWLCPACQEKKAEVATVNGKTRNMKKWEWLQNLPEVIIMQLSRATLSGGKDTTRVKVPLKHDFGQYVNPKFPPKDSDTSYDLVGVISHKGGANAGHYICWVKNGQDWWCVNDLGGKDGRVVSTEDDPPRFDGKIPKNGRKRGKEGFQPCLLIWEKSCSDGNDSDGAASDSDPEAGDAQGTKQKKNLKGSKPGSADPNTDDQDSDKNADKGNDDGAADKVPGKEDGANAEDQARAAAAETTTGEDKIEMILHLHVGDLEPQEFLFMSFPSYAACQDLWHQLSIKSCIVARTKTEKDTTQREVDALCANLQFEPQCSRWFQELQFEVGPVKDAQNPRKVNPKGSVKSPSLRKDISREAGLDKQSQGNNPLQANTLREATSKTTTGGKEAAVPVVTLSPSPPPKSKGAKETSTKSRGRNRRLGPTTRSVANAQKE